MVNLKKKFQREKQRRKKQHRVKTMDSWVGDEGVHLVQEGPPPSAEDYEQMTREYQKRIRNSPMWDEMVKEFGKQKAEEMLKEFVAKPG